MLNSTNSLVADNSCPFLVHVAYRFTELYVDEISEAGDIQLLVRDYLESLALPATQLASIVTFFQAAKMAAKTKLTTGPSDA